MKLLLLLVPVIGAVTGWVIVTIFLKVLFWPSLPTRVPWTNYSFQGIIPKKRDELAAGLREMITAWLQSAAGESGMAPDLLHNLVEAVEEAARERLEEKIPVLVPRPIKEGIIRTIEDLLRREIPAFVETLADNLRSGQVAGIDLCRWAEDYVRGYDLSVLAARLSRSREIVLLKTGAAALGLGFGFLQLLVVRLVLSAS
jgi:hypothetical protein